MNYFRCTVGGSGNKLKLTVTCDSGFAGATIFCTDGTTTLTATCPSSSPYTVIFKIPNAGTWTISSGSDSTTVVILDTATLHQKPTGSTATPVNVIQTWLHCANIWNKSYTTINQVLADTSTLLALISSNNAADYMARSTNWASSVCANQTAMGYIGNNNYCANKLLTNSTWLSAICNSTYFESVLNVKVPTMTSNTAPYGEAITSGAQSGSAAYYAFDGNDSTAYIGSNKTQYDSTTYVCYKFINPISVKRIKARVSQSESGTARSQSIIFEASNDNNNWFPLTGTYTDSYKYAEPKSYDVQPTLNDNHYLYFRVRRTSISAAQAMCVWTLQFYGRA